MTQVGQNWSQLVEELNDWLMLGRDLQGVLDKTEVGQP
jgi:hypothetical protein